MKTYLALILSFLIGGVAGAFLARGLQRTSVAAADNPAASEKDGTVLPKEQHAAVRARVAQLERLLSYQQDANAELLQRIRQLESEAGATVRPPSSRNARADTATEAAPATPATVSLHEDGIETAVSSVAITAPEEAPYSDYEKEALEEIVGRARSRLDEIEVAAATVVNSEPDKVVIEVPPFGEDGRAIEQQFREDVVRLLGEERAEAYLKQMRRRVTNELSGFGQMPQQVTITRLQSGGYLMSTSIRRQGINSSFSSFTSRKVEELPERFKGVF